MLSPGAAWAQFANTAHSRTLQFGVAHMARKFSFQVQCLSGDSIKREKLLDFDHFFYEEPEKPDPVKCPLSVH